MSRYGLNIFVNLVCVKGGIEISGGKDEIFNKGAETIAWPSGKKKLAPTLVSHGAKILM